MNREEAKALTEAAVAHYDKSVEECAEKVLEKLLEYIKACCQNRSYKLSTNPEDILKDIFKMTETTSGFRADVSKRVKFILVAEKKYSVVEDARGNFTISWT